MKKSVRTLLNLSVQKGEQILYSHSSALCLHFIFEIVFPAVPPFTHTVKTETNTYSASIWWCLLTHQVALSQHSLDLQDVPVPQRCFVSLCVPWAALPGCQSYYWLTCATIPTIPNILGPSSNLRLLRLSPSLVFLKDLSNHLHFPALGLQIVGRSLF